MSLRFASALALASTLVISAASVRAEDQAQANRTPGHSAHGEVFNEGPRQAAYLMGGTGKIRFPITTSRSEVQQFFDQGLGQYYGFWYFESERSFRQMAALEPENAMAYWGMALANFENPQRGKQFIVEAEKRKDKLSERERMHVEALAGYMKHDTNKAKERGENYARALERLIYKYPDDVEAKALLALQLWRNRSSGSPITSYLAIDALLGEVFAVEPMHPAHHFRIHLWDGERHAKALHSAAHCGQAAPSIAHMWHMSGHIFSGLKRYEDACWQQEASARVDHAHMMRDLVLPDQIHNFAHNNEWLIRNLIHVGRKQDALDLAKNMCELPRHPKYNTLDKGSSKYGRERLFEVCRSFELWEELIALAETPYLEPTDRPEEQIKRLRYLGVAWYRLANREQGEKVQAELQQRWQEELAARDRAGFQAEVDARNEGKRDKDRRSAHDQARQKHSRRIEAIEKALQELEGHDAVLAGDFKKGLDLLKRAGGVDKSYLARVQFQAGERDQALKAAANYVRSNPSEVLPLAAQVELLWMAEKKDEAREAFTRLRDASGSIDRTAPPLARLTPIAIELGFGENWVVSKPVPSDAGVRPSLDSLGPFRWQPPLAPTWTLRDADGKEHTLSDYRGRPLVMIFFLGHGCLHCAEQLKAFGPRVKDFQAAGIDVIAVSSDDLAGLKMSIENYQEPIPMKLLADDRLEAFKAYRCHDDFESLPLHGTFIIDGEGRIRWHDTGADPFMDAQFVLQEAQRLLAPPSSPARPVDSTIGAE